MIECVTFAGVLLAGCSSQGGSASEGSSNQQQLSAPHTEEEAAVEYVRMETSKGTIVLELDRASAPVTVENFLTYVHEDFYEDTIFHRVIDGFMIQGGGITENMSRKQTRDPISNEFNNGLTNDRGTIAMARTQDPNSATSQFFINLVDNANLDQAISGGAGYAVFGRVIAGMDVVDAIAKVPTQARGGHGNVPVEPVLITRVEEISRDEATSASE